MTNQNDTTNKGFKPCEVALTRIAMGLIPKAMQEYVRQGGKLYLVERPENGNAFISTASDPTGHVCTYVSEAHVTVVDRHEEGLPFA